MTKSEQMTTVSKWQFITPDFDKLEFGNLLTCQVSIDDEVSPLMKNSIKSPFMNFMQVYPRYLHFRFLSRLMLGVTDKGTVTAMKKEGSGSLDASSVEDMLEVGVIMLFGF